MVRIRRQGRAWQAYSDMLKTLFQSHNRQEVSKWISSHKEFLTEEVKNNDCPRQPIKYSKIINL